MSLNMCADSALGPTVEILPAVLAEIVGFRADLFQFGVSHPVVAKGRSLCVRVAVTADRTGVDSVAAVRAVRRNHGRSIAVLPGSRSLCVAVARSAYSASVYGMATLRAGRSHNCVPILMFPGSWDRFSLGLPAARAGVGSRSGSSASGRLGDGTRVP